MFYYTISKIFPSCISLIRMHKDIGAWAASFTFSKFSFIDFFHFLKLHDFLVNEWLQQSSENW